MPWSNWLTFYGDIFYIYVAFNQFALFLPICRAAQLSQFASNMSGQKLRMLLLTLAPVLALYVISSYHITLTVAHLNQAYYMKHVRMRIRQQQYSFHSE